MNLWTALEKTDSAISHPRLDDEAAEPLETEYVELYAQVAELEDIHAFRRYLADYIATEYRKYVGAEEAEGTRSKPLCTCAGETCALQEGKLLPRLQGSHATYVNPPDPEDLLTDAILQHSNEIILSEALHEWRRKKAQVRVQLVSLRRRARQAR